MFQSSKLNWLTTLFYVAVYKMGMIAQPYMQRDIQQPLQLSSWLTSETTLL